MKRMVMVFLLIWGMGQLASAQSARISPAIDRWRQQVDAPPLKVWILFSDKGERITERLEQLAVTLPPAVRLRRQWQRPNQPLVDVTDLPVYPPYLQQVRQRVERIVVVSRWINGVSAWVSPRQIDALLELPFVRRIQPVARFKVPEPVSVEPVQPDQMSSVKGTAQTTLEYGPSYNQLDQINVIPLHEMGYTGKGVTIAMLDAGFQNLEHEAFAYMDIVDTWDFPNGDANVENENGELGEGTHGTYTLSTIGGFKEGMLIGPAFEASFLLYKTEVTDWERHVEEDYWVAGAERAEQKGAWIISSSLGYNVFDQGEGDYSWEDMDGNTTIVTRGADIAARKGILVVNSAGNEGNAPEPQNTLVAPSDGDSVIAVAAVDEFGVRASFSSVGPAADGRIKPDLAARGVRTYCASPATNQSYTQVSGTSLSCPLVAGAAALVWQVNPRLTNMQVRRALRQTASQADQPDRYLGWGIVDAYAAAFYYTPRIVFRPFPDTIGLRQQYQIEAVVTSHFPLKKDSVVVTYRFANQDWQQAVMTPVNDTLYRATIESPGVPAQMDYYISAVADSGKGYVPSFAPEEYFSTYLSSDASGLDEPEVITRQFYLTPAYPNPFNGTTWIELNVRQTTTVELAVYNLQGQKISQLFQGELEVGEHKFSWTPHQQGSGMYFIIARGEKERQFRKVLYIR